MKRETQRQLKEALKAHMFDLEITRAVTSGLDREVLDRRIEAIQLLLEWVSPALVLDPLASPPNATEASHLWLGHSCDTPMDLGV